MADEESPLGTVAKGKWAGVPIWAWGAGLAAVILIYMWWRNKQNAAVSATTATVADQPTYADTGTGGDYGNIGDGYIPGSSQTGVSSSLTNPEWLSNAEQALTNSGHSPVDIIGALQRFMTGQPLSASDQQIVNAAVSAEGLPPDTSQIVGSSGTAAPASTSNPKITIISTGTALPSLQGQTIALLVTPSGYPSGKTMPMYIETAGPVSGGQYSIIHTFYANGNTPTTTSAPITQTGSVNVRVADANGVVSNVIALKLGSVVPRNTAVKK